MKDIFIKLLTESTLMQGTLSLMVVGVWLYLIVAGTPVPDSLVNIVGLTVGFFFGGKYALAAAKTGGQ